MITARRFEQTDADEDDVQKYPLYPGAYFRGRRRHRIPADVWRTEGFLHESVYRNLRPRADRMAEDSGNRMAGAVFHLLGF